MYYLICFVLGFFFMVNMKSKDDGIKDQWSLKEKINQNSLEKQLVASTQLKDKEFPNIQFTLNMVCSDGDFILVIKSNSSKIVDGNYESLEFDLDWSSGFVFPGDNSRGSTITTRNGNSIINYGVYNYDFTDSNRKWYSNVIYMNVDHTLPSGIGQNAPIVINSNSNPETKAFMSLGLGFQPEHLVDYQTDKFFTSNEWYIKLPTVKGTPIIKIDLNSQSLKKIYGDCKWKPAFTQTIVSDSNVHSLSTTEIDKRSVIDQQVVYQNDIEENFIREQEKKEEMSDSNKSKDAISNNKIAKNEKIKDLDSEEENSISNINRAKELTENTKNNSEIEKISSPVYTASFDCNKASIPSEKVICNSSKLSTLDIELSKTYKEVRMISSNTEQLKHEQIQFIKLIRACSDNESCIQENYSKRIFELKKALN